MNTTQKTLAMLIAATTIGASNTALAEIELGEVVISGYLDMSMSTTSVDDGEDSDNAGLDRAEVRFNSQLDDKVSIEAHVAGGADEDYDLEQAHMVYQATDQFSIKAGKYLSALGWEAFHAPDLFQWSVSTALVYPAFFNGVSAKYKTDSFEVYGSLASGIWDSTDTNSNEFGYEAAFKFTGVEGLTLFLGTASGAPGDTPATDYDQTLINFWASYAVGGLTLAAEFNDLSDWGGENIDGESWLVMMNYAFDGGFGLTLRTSAIDVDDGTDREKYTIAGSYAATDNVSLVLEFNTTTDNQTDSDTEQLALEMIVVF